MSLVAAAAAAAAAATTTTSTTSSSCCLASAASKLSPELCCDSRTDMFLSSTKALKRKATPRKLVHQQFSTAAVPAAHEDDEDEDVIDDHQRLKFLDTEEDIRPLKLTKFECDDVTNDEPVLGLPTSESIVISADAVATEEDCADSTDFLRRCLEVQSAMQQQWNLFYLQAALEQQKNVTAALNTSSPQGSSTSSSSSSIRDANSSAKMRMSQDETKVALQRRIKHEAVSTSRRIQRLTICPSMDSSPEAQVSCSNNKKNYKNMTRERRIEANARERSRVHTISAAFEGLRRAVPLYSANQKVSKLAVLRIACQYIMALAQLAGLDYSADESNPSFGDCIEALVQTIQTEGKMKRKL